MFRRLFAALRGKGHPEPRVVPEQEAKVPLAPWLTERLPPCTSYRDGNRSLAIEDGRLHYFRAGDEEAEEISLAEVANRANFWLGKEADFLLLFDTIQSDLNSDRPYERRLRIIDLPQMQVVQELILFISRDHTETERLIGVGEKDVLIDSGLALYAFSAETGRLSKFDISCGNGNLRFRVMELDKLAKRLSLVVYETRIDTVRMIRVIDFAADADYVMDGDAFRPFDPGNQPADLGYRLDQVESGFLARFDASFQESMHTQK